MDKSQSKFIVDESIPEDRRIEIGDEVKSISSQMMGEVGERSEIIQKRQDFYEGRHHKWTNVIGQTNKQQEGHIVAVFNYISKFCKLLEQKITNTPPKISIKSKDESNEIETSRAETVETAIYSVLNENKFLDLIFKKLTNNQVRDGDFVFECKVLEQDGKRRIVISPNEDLLKITVLWDDAQGSSFSGVIYSDLWTTSKILREFGYEADPLRESEAQGVQKGDHVRNQFGLFSDGQTQTVNIPTGQGNLPKARITDYWGYQVVNGEVKVVNVVLINNDMVQIIATDYQKIPKFIGHSLVIAGKPWSKGFIDDLIDPQIELNDRTGEEGDLIRVGAHMKFLAINMPDFDANSVKPGSGQVIFIEGENADFRPLQMTISPFPSADYITRVLEHMHAIGIPKIGLAAGTAPYTGKVGAIQFQPIADLIQDFRIQWNITIVDLVKMIQQYFIDYFPESHQFMREYITDPVTGENYEGELVVRDVDLDWDNVLPLSRSDKVVDASTVFDRGAISMHSYLGEAGFRDPGAEIKKLKKESKDEELMVLRQKFAQLAPGVTKATIEQQRQVSEAAEDNAATAGMMQDAVKPPQNSSTPAPILNQSQNEGRRGVSSASGTPTGQTATPEGAVAQTTQNLNAQQGV